MAGTKYITSLPGILKLITALVGVIILGLALASWPRETVREAAKEDNSTIEIWKFYIFLAVAIIALLFSVFTILLFLFVGRTSDAINMTDAGASIILGLFLVVTSSLLLHECVTNYNEYVDGCQLLPAGLGTKSLEDDVQAALQCISDHQLDEQKICQCVGRYMIRLGTTVTAGAFGIINFLVLMAAGGFSLNR